MNWKRTAWAVAAALPIVALLGFGLTRDPKQIPSPLPGQPAPEFALRVFAWGDSAGGAPRDWRTIADTIRLASLRGEVVVINFWASWCAPCSVEHEALTSVARRYAGRGVHFLGVLYNDTPEDGLAWIARRGGQSYPSVDDEGARTAIDYGLYGVPETFFIGRDGRVAHKHTGAVTEELLIAQIERLRAIGAGAGAGAGA